MTERNFQFRERGVFQPSRAEIAEEMRLRLELGSYTRETPRQPTASRH